MLYVLNIILEIAQSVMRDRVGAEVGFLIDIRIYQVWFVNLCSTGQALMDHICDVNNCWDGNYGENNNITPVTTLLIIPHSLPYQHPYKYKLTATFR